MVVVAVVVVGGTVVAVVVAGADEVVVVGGMVVVVGAVTIVVVVADPPPFWGTNSGLTQYSVARYDNVGRAGTAESRYRPFSAVGVEAGDVMHPDADETARFVMPFHPYAYDPFGW